MSLPRFHHAPIEPAPAATVTLTGSEARHARDVVRLRAGDRAVLFDGAGVDVIATVIAVGAAAITFSVVAVSATAPELAVRVTAVPAMLKGDAMDALVRDVTMLGAVAIAPVMTTRTVVPARASTAATVVDRWRRIALASAKQCGRSVLPAITGARPLDAALRDPAWAEAARIMLCEPATGVASEMPMIAAGTAVVLLSGPEGGWTPHEIAQAAALGWRPWTCSPLTLRAETAPIVALGIVGSMTAAGPR
jgi:16S rRNA (uracil1498-N3)-methyltransferase